MPDLSLSLALDRVAIAAHRPTTLELLIDIQTTLGPATARGPVAVALVLDVSPSMQGAPITQVVDATRRILELARPDDAVALVTFAHDARVLAPLARLDREHLAICRRALSELGLRHATNIGAGLELGVQTLALAPAESHRSVLLLSDGAPNVGRTTAAQLSELAHRARHTASITTLGFGVDHDDRVLGAIAESGGGTYRFIADPATCGFDLVQAFGAQADVVARDVSVSLWPAAHVRVRALHPGGRASEREPAVVALPDLVARSGRLLLAELELDSPARAGARVGVARAVLSATRVGAATSETTEASVTVEVSDREGPRVREVHRRALRVRAEEARGEARRRADAGDFAAAASITRAMVATLQHVEGGVVPGESLYEALDQLLDDTALYARRPDAHAYAAFRRGQRADLATADASAAAPQATSDQARAVALALAGVPEDAAVVFEDGRRVPLPVDGVIGRSASCDVVVASGQVSRQHARVFALAGDFWISDLGSSNTLAINGRVAREPHRLVEGDRVGIGDRVLRFTAR